MRRKPRIPAAPQPARRSRRAVCRLAPAALALLTGAATGVAQVNDAFVTGRDFAGLSLPLDPQPGDAFIESRGGWAWSDGESSRLLLEGDVRVRVSVYDFVADRAVVWVEPRTQDGEDIWQLAFYFENMRTPLASAKFSQNARRLLVTVAVRGDVRLRIDLLEQDRPEGDTFLLEAESRFTRRIAELAAQGVPQLPAAGFNAVDRAFFEAAGPPTPIDPDAPIFPRNGVLTFQGPDRTFITGETENALVVTGGVIVEYADLDANRIMQLTAQNAVVFLDPGSVADIVRAGTGDVRGIYLEGGVVVTDGEFTVRGPRVYYDVANDRAALLDAVFYTFDGKRGTPLYVRADIIRQESLGQWEAKNAKLSNVAFADPSLSIGARDVRITQDHRADGTPRTLIDARRISLRLNDTPIFPFPNQRGEFDQTLLPTIKIGTKDGDPAIRTSWDFDSLFNLDSGDALSGDVLIDAFFARGPALGFELDWSSPDADGSVLAYGIHDTGDDEFSTGASRDAPRDNRGLFLAEHQWRVDDAWTLSVEFSAISDEAFADAFFESVAETRREVTSRAVLTNRSEQGLFTAQVQGSFNDFTPNEFLLQSRGYQVQRLPEISYARIGDTFFNGRLSYFGDTRAGILEPTFVEPRLRNFGFVSPAIAQAAFGLNPEQSLADGLNARGFRENSVARFDTRHEFRAPFDIGQVRVTPFTVGRLTAYDEEFEDYRQAAGFDDTDQSRLWVSAGATFSTSVNRVYNSVDSEFFDLHRLRHIIEPSATVWTAGSTLNSEALPVFDESVESLTEGRAFRFGLTNTFQTQRGGPGAWRNVDWLVLRAEYVYSSDDTARESAVGRFFESRPELSRFGEFAAGDATLQLTDAVGLVGSVVYDTDNSTLDVASAGILIDHGFGFTSFAEMRRIDANVVDSTFINFGASYELSARYAVAGAASYDLENSTFEDFGFEIRRRSPQWTMEIGLDYNDTRDDVALSFQLRPWGGPTDRVRNSLSRERFTSPGRAFGAEGSPYKP